MASELRKPVYWSVSVRVIGYDQVLQQMATVKWDVKEIMSQHNAYIDILIQVCICMYSIYVKRINSFTKNSR